MKDLSLIDTATLIAILSVLTFVVNVIVEVVKDLPFFKKLPTKLVVLVIAIIITVCALVAYCQYKNIVIMWYFIAGAIVVAFFVAYAAMYGFDTLKELWDRYKIKKED